MATLTNECIVLDSLTVPATWRAYVELMEARGDRAGPLYTYLDGRLTIVSPGLNHESTKTRLAAMLSPVLLAMRIRFREAGSLTIWGGPLAEETDRKGSEPDLCYYLRDIDALAGKDRVVMGEDPPPHLAIEVAVSHGATNHLAVLHHYRVPEVWVCRQAGVEFLLRAPRGRWRSTDVSLAIPCLSADEVAQWLYDPELDEGAFRRRFSRWVKKVVQPRIVP
jgi:Uma2 family endonuclease